MAKREHGKTYEILVALENVPGILKFFRPIGEELSRMGYEIEAGLYSAAEVKASHERHHLQKLDLPNIKNPKLFASFF
jgi:site-specific DNA-cytosine methylase